MKVTDIETVGGAEYNRLIERLAGRAGYRIFGAFRRSERLSASVTPAVVERLDVLADTLGISRSEVAFLVLVAGVGVLEDELIEAWKEVNDIE